MDLIEFFKNQVNLTKRQSQILNTYAKAGHTVAALEYLASFMGNVPKEAMQTRLMTMKGLSRSSQTDKLAARKPGEIAKQAKTRKIVFRKMNARQLFIYKTLWNVNSKASYLESFSQAKGKGQILTRVQNVKREFVRSGRDVLARKGNGAILELARSMKNASSNKSPYAIHKGDWIGVEIECVIPKDNELIATTRRNSDSCINLLTDYITDLGLKYVTVKSDGSIDASSDYFPVELTVFYRRSNPAPLKDLCNFLGEIGAKVNKSCGLHVHLDCRDVLGLQTETQLNKRITRFKNAVGVMARLVPASRRSNTYCQVGVSARNGTRYFAVNTTALSKYQTIEIRLHSGSVNFEKISNWAELCFSISRSEDLTNDGVTSVEELLANSGASDAVIQYYLGRAKLFEGSSPDVEHEDDTTEDEPEFPYNCTDCGCGLTEDSEIIFHDESHCYSCAEPHIDEERERAEQEQESA
jgi:hypothetical protein